MREKNIGLMGWKNMIGNFLSVDYFFILNNAN